MAEIPLDTLNKEAAQCSSFVPLRKERKEESKEGKGIKKTISKPNAWGKG